MKGSLVFISDFFRGQGEMGREEDFLTGQEGKGEEQDH